ANFWLLFKVPPSTHTAAFVECRVPALLPLRFPQPIPGAPLLTSTPFRTPADSSSLVTCVLLIENCHHYLCLSFGVHSRVQFTGRTPVSPPDRTGEIKARAHRP